jgi:predicted kinase
MPKCYQLIGVPASGKSTWYSKQDWLQDAAYISTDRYVEEYAKNMGKTYSEVFEEVMPMCVEYMTGDVVHAREAGQDIVWDQTSTTLASRARKFNALPASLNYEHIAVVFRTPNLDELKERLASRPGKEIPWEVVQGMLDNWEEPTLEEGFTEILRWYKDQFQPESSTDG